MSYADESSQSPVPDSSNGQQLVLVDDPAPGVRRVTLNRPEKRNALNHILRGQLIAALHAADDDPEVKVTIVRGAGTCFSAGYELGGGNEGVPLPHFTPAGEGQWPRHVTETWMSIWDLAKPVIAQVHGYCLAGGSELATGCDLVYVAEDAKMGYPAVRFGVPDMHFHAWFLGMRAAMEMMVTGDSISGLEAVRLGWANRAFPEAELDDAVLEIARAHRARSPPTSCSSTSARCTARWTPWACAPGSGPAPSSARSASTRRACRSSSPRCAPRASPPRCKSATSPSGITARRHRARSKLLP